MITLSLDLIETEHTRVDHESQSNNEKRRVIKVRVNPQDIKNITLGYRKTELDKLTVVAPWVHSKDLTQNTKQTFGSVNKIIFSCLNTYIKHCLLN
jgi:hypothetical protein